MAKDYLSFVPVADVSVEHEIFPSTNTNAYSALSDNSNDTYIGVEYDTSSTVDGYATSTFELGAKKLPRALQMDFFACVLTIKSLSVYNAAGTHDLVVYINEEEVFTSSLTYPTHAVTESASYRSQTVEIPELVTIINNYLQANSYTTLPAIKLKLTTTIGATSLSTMSSYEYAQISEIDLKLDYETDDDNSITHRKIILRPSADISVGHTLVPSASTAAYLSINEEVADGNSSYIECGNTALGEENSSSFVISTNIFPEGKIEITDIRLFTSYMVTLYSGESMTHTFTLSANDATTFGSVVRNGADTGGGYSLSEISLSDKESLMTVLNSSSSFPEITLTIDSVFVSDSSKNIGSSHITQVYIELEWEYASGIYTKKNNTWSIVKQIFKKNNGVWATITPDECKSLLQSSMLRDGILPTYSITYSLSNCTSDNNIMTITNGENYNAIITANEGYAFASVTIKINGVEVDSSVYWTESETEHMGVISIPNVSGNIDITITTSKLPLLVDFAYTDNGDGTYTITDWLGTYQGKPSTLCYIPDSSSIIL